MKLLLGLLDEKKNLIEGWVREIFWQDRGHCYTNGKSERFANTSGKDITVWGIRVYDEKGFEREGPLQEGLAVVGSDDAFEFIPHSIEVGKESYDEERVL